MKRGLSPLIAMVLAIAFIAAILAMVVSWIFTHKPNVRMCEELSTSLSFACEDGEMIRFEIRNGAQIDIEVISVASEEGDSLEEGIEANQFGEYSVPRPSSGILTITPLLGHDHEIECLDHSLEVPLGALEAC